MNPEIIHDAVNRRFLCVVDALESYLTYEICDGDVLDFDHTYTPPALRGRGIAQALVQAGFDYAKANGFRVIPSCSYVHTWSLRHPEVTPLLFDKNGDGSYNIRCRIDRK